MAKIIECLGGKTGGFDQITNKDAIILYSLANGINIDYASIFWEDIIIKLNKKHREKVVPYTRFLSLLMMHKLKEGYGDDEGKKTMSSEEAEQESTNSDSDDEDETRMTGSMVPSSIKKLKKFDFITEDGRHIHLTKEEINHQKKLEEEAKAEATKIEGEVRKAELVDLLGPEVVNKYYNDKLQYDTYCDNMLNKRAESRIANCDILTRKGPITLKVYREDDISEIIPEFKATELGIDLDKPLSEHDPLDRLNDLENKKRKHADDIHEFFRANKRLKSSVQYKDHQVGIVLNEPVLEEINHQKKLEEKAKAKATKIEEDVRKAELVDLLGPEVVNKYYNDKLQYDTYCDNMLNKRAESRIANCDILTRKGPITLKVYREDDISEIIPEFKASDLHLERIDYLCTTEAELGIDLDKPLSEQDPLDRLNDLENKKRTHADEHS
ncbi:hypothetical protein Tco_0559623 [Tanacetum coccineum]